MIKICNELVKIDSFTRLDSISSLNKMTVSKNQIASFQIVLEPKTFSIVNVSDNPALTDKIGASRYRIEVISEYDADLYNVLTLEDENGIEYCDILTHQPFVEHKGNMPCSVWVDLKINKKESSDVVVNVYHTVSTNDENLVYSDTINVEVLNVEIPCPKDYSIYVDLWQHNSNIARYYEVPLWGDSHFEILEKVVQTLSDIGQKSVMIIASECPWNGWGTHIFSKDGSVLYEHSIISLKRSKDGKLYADFSYMQRYIDLCNRYGINGDISVYGLLGVWNLPLFPSRTTENYPETIMVRYYDERDGSYKYLNQSEEIKEYLRLIIDYFKKTGQFSRVRIAADEPKNDEKSIKNYDSTITILREIDSEIQFKLAVDKDSVIDKYEDIISDISTSFPCTTRYYDKLDSSKHRLWYVCNIPDKPNTFLKSPLFESRVIGILNSVFGYDGFLRWAYTCWTKNPREDIRYATQGLPVGDICLVYPEKNGEIALSLRYKALQRGIEDFEIMNVLKQKGKLDVIRKANQIIKLNTNPKEFMNKKKITHDNLFSKDIADYESMRTYLLNELLKTV